MPKVTITINGKKIEAVENSNLLETAIQNKIEIPHLCYDPRIKSFGSCRLCFVDTGGPRGPVAACGTAVEEGMNVITDSEALSELRLTALELLLSEHCGDCIAPCQSACPAHIDIQGYIALIDRKEYKQAADLIKEAMPLPSICGRVCPRFCEDECRRNIVDEPVNICDLKRFAGDFDLDMISAYRPQTVEKSFKSVAVVGGGPAGLTAAYYLALKGHAVTLYDRGPLLGGMMRYGIPEYRLPKELLDREINLIADLCREVRLGENLGEHFTLEELKENYDAIFLGLGCQAAQGMGLAGEDTPGIIRGIEFLRRVAEGTPPELGKRVAVVGGGNTAMDAARTALRLGAEEVNVIYRRSRTEMPASALEIEEAEEEGINFHYLTNPVSVLGAECVLGVECVQMELGEPDESGRRRPIAVEGSEFKLDIDNVIMAIGQTLDQENARSCSLDLSGKTLTACSETGATPSEGVFAAGDAVTGPATVVEAVGAARRAAAQIDRYLSGSAVDSAREDYNCSMGSLDQLNPEDFAGHEKAVRLPVHHTSPEERKRSFKEYNPGLTEKDALDEAKRCLSCGCQDLFDCDLRRLAGEYELNTDRLGVEKKRYPIYNEHPYVVQDPNKCVLCASCVRICNEVQDANALCLVNRGYDTVVKPTLELPLRDTTCESCGQCISACPTGALTARGPFLKPGPWRDDRVVDSTCTLCGIGCTIDMHMAADKITRITSPLRDQVNDGNLCLKGRFGYGFVQGPERIIRPLIRRDQDLAEADWKEALSSAAAGLKKVIKEYGTDSVAVVLSPYLTNEEAYMARELATTAFSSDKIFAAGLPASAGISAGRKPFSYEEVAESDFILVVDANLPDDFPIIAQKVRKAIGHGAKLAMLGAKSSRMDNKAGVSLAVNPGALSKALKGLLSYMAGPAQQVSLGDAGMKEAMNALPQALRGNPAELVGIASDFLAAKKPAVIVDGDSMEKEAYGLLSEMISLSGSAEKGRVLPLYRGGNTRGLLELGFENTLPDGEAYVSAEGSPCCYPVKLLNRSDIKGLLIIGDNLLVEKPATLLFSAALVSQRPEPSAAADISFPLCTYAETKGTVVNCEGRVRELKAAFEPLSGKSNQHLFSELAGALGVVLESASEKEIFAGMKNVLVK